MAKPKKFIIFGIQRTGTIYLMRILDSHPQIFCIGEAFQDIDTPCHHQVQIPRFQTFIKKSIIHRALFLIQRRRLVYEYLDNIYTSLSSDAFGFKLMLNQYENYPELSEYLKTRNYRIIHLIRKNLLKTHISQIRASRTGVYVARKLQRQIKINIPTNSLLYSLTDLKRKNLAIENYIKNLKLPCFTVYYENLQQNNNELNLILEYLEVDDTVDLSPKTKKITSDDLSTVVENYDEVVAILKNSQHEKYL